jgi:hypothetical protein
MALGNDDDIALGFISCDITDEQHVPKKSDQLPKQNFPKKRFDERHRFSLRTQNTMGPTTTGPHLKEHRNARSRKCCHGSADGRGPAR